jgi:hypothetical protein
MQGWVCDAPHGHCIQPAASLSPGGSGSSKGGASPAPVFSPGASPSPPSRSNSSPSRSWGERSPAARATSSTGRARARSCTRSPSPTLTDMSMSNEDRPRGESPTQTAYSQPVRQGNKHVERPPSLRRGAPSAELRLGRERGGASARSPSPYRNGDVAFVAAPTGEPASSKRGRSRTLTPPRRCTYRARSHTLTPPRRYTYCIAAE